MTHLRPWLCLILLGALSLNQDLMHAAASRRTICSAPQARRGSIGGALRRLDPSGPPRARTGLSRSVSGEVFCAKAGPGLAAIDDWPKPEKVANRRRLAGRQPAIAARCGRSLRGDERRSAMSLPCPRRTTFQRFATRTLAAGSRIHSGYASDVPRRRARRVSRRGSGEDSLQAGLLSRTVPSSCSS